MYVNLGDCEMAIAFLNWLPDRVEGPIQALSAAYVDVEKLSFETVQTWHYKGDQCHAQHDQEPPKISQKSPLAGRRGPQDRS